MEITQGSVSPYGAHDNNIKVIARGLEHKLGSNAIEVARRQYEMEERDFPAITTQFRITRQKLAAALHHRVKQNFLS